MNSPAVASSRLALYAKAVVGCTFVLIFLGGLVTSWQAGMAVPDWPLSFGSLNPDGWWANVPVRLEHGHRQFAAFVGLLTTILCAWVWRDWRPLLWAVVASPVLTFGAKAAGLPPLVLMHVSIWSFAAVFALALLLSRCAGEALPATTRKVAFAAFLGVCLQATFGGLRVTLETAGHFEAALTLRIVHGCIAQAELCLLVTLAVLLSPAWREPLDPISSRTLRPLAWITTAAIYVQLVFGATMRHLGAGLAIPTFPAASPEGSWVPAVHGPYTDINFAHTRVGATIVSLLVITLAIRVLRQPKAHAQLQRPAWLMLALLAIQLTLGVFVIWHGKPPTLTTFHVVNGALLLATSLWLALRVQRASAAAILPGETSPQFLAKPVCI